MIDLKQSASKECEDGEWTRSMPDSKRSEAGIAFAFESSATTELEAKVQRQVFVKRPIQTR